jgi:hypothetical protein
MSTETAPDAAPAPARGRSPVIRVDGSGEGFTERVLKRQVPAWLISVAVHGVMLGLFVVVNVFFIKEPPSLAVGAEAQELQTKVEDDEKQQNFDNPDIGLDPNLPTNYNIERIEDVSVSGNAKLDEAVGNNMGEGPPQTLPPPPGLGEQGGGGGIDAAMAGTGGLADGGGFERGIPLQPGQGFKGRSGATRDKNLKAGGGNTISEAAVTRGLIWLSKQQRADGSWEIDGGAKSKISGTGVALLPFLAAGFTHKGAPKEAQKDKLSAKYPGQIEAGLKYLVSKQTASGDFGTLNMYEHAIATMAVCEAFGMTNDVRYKGAAQNAINFVIKAQHPGGGWRYTPGIKGDTSVTGWQIQALKSAHLAGLKVPKETLSKAIAYLDSVAYGTPAGSNYGYEGKSGSNAMTAVGLLCRQYLGWGPKNPGLIGGVEFMKKEKPPIDPKTNPAPPEVDDIYYYYYATQVVHFYGGPDWHEFWNPRMRDWLLARQVSGATANAGSWNPDSTLTGSNGGRLMCSCLSLLTLEVYYRHLPLYKRDAGAMKDLEGS